MFLLLFALFASDVGGAQASEGVAVSTPASLSKPTLKHYNDLKEVLNSLKDNFVDGSRKKVLDMVFGIAGGIIDYNVDTEGVKEVKELRLQVSNIKTEIAKMIEEVKHACIFTNFELISREAGSLLNLLVEAIIGLWNGNDHNVITFLKACKSQSLMMKMYSIKEMLDYSEWDLMRSALGSNHKFNTLNRTKTRIITTANTLAFVETFRMKFANETTPETEQRQSEVVFEPIEGITRLVDDHIEVFGKMEYFGNETLSYIIDKVMRTHAKYDENVKASSILNELMEVHTSDRFIVAIYGEDCYVDEIVKANKASYFLRMKNASVFQENLFIDPNYRTIVYRSKLAINATEVKGDFVVHMRNVPTDHHYCYDVTAEMVRSEYQKILRSRNMLSKDALNASGFLLLLDGCGAVVKYDSRAGNPKQHAVTCRPNILKEAMTLGERINLTAIIYPA